MKQRILLLSLILLAGCSGGKNQAYDVAAYVWPAFHNEPRWAEIGLFPEGKGEWESVYKAAPKWEGHRQPRIPEWGYYDEADPRMQEKSIGLATRFGVNTFIFDWYWYDDRPFLEGPLDAFVAARNSKRMKFYLMWANHTATSYWDREEHDKNLPYWAGEVDRETFDHIADHIVSKYLSLPNYYRIDGKPVFAIYEVGTFIKGLGGIENAREALESLRDKCIAAGLPGIHLQAILWQVMPDRLDGVPAETGATASDAIAGLGFESLTTYQWCHYVPLKEYGAWGEEAVAGYDRFGSEFGRPYFPHVSVDWDNNARFPDDVTSPSVTDVTPSKFKNFLKDARSYLDAHPDQPQLVTINAWNEWSEGSYLEPDTHFGTAFLEAVHDVFVRQEE